MGNKYKEVEFKYNANKIKLKDFQKMIEDMNPNFLIETSSWDFYFTNQNGESIRYRKSEIQPELTIKRKLNNKNNQNRIEVNLELGTKNQDETAAEFVKLLGYELNFKIYKSCFIYYFDEVDVVYYIVYDENMVEQGRFLEIEFLEEKAHNYELKYIMNTLNKYERNLKGLGLSKNNRIPYSLFEMFKK